MAFESGEGTEDLLSDRPGSRGAGPAEAVSHEQSRERQGVRDQEVPHHHFAVADAERRASSSPEDLLRNCFACLSGHDADLRRNITPSSVDEEQEGEQVYPQQAQKVPIDPTSVQTHGISGVDSTRQNANSIDQDIGQAEGQMEKVDEDQDEQLSLIHI